MSAPNKSRNIPVVVIIRRMNRHAKCKINRYSLIIIWLMLHFYIIKVSFLLIFNHFCPRWFSNFIFCNHSVMVGKRSKKL